MENTIMTKKHRLHAAVLSLLAYLYPTAPMLAKCFAITTAAGESPTTRSPFGNCGGDGNALDPITARCTPLLMHNMKKRRCNCSRSLSTTVPSPRMRAEVNQVAILGRERNRVCLLATSSSPTPADGVDPLIDPRINALSTTNLDKKSSLLSTDQLRGGHQDESTIASIWGGHSNNATVSDLTPGTDFFVESSGLLQIDSTTQKNTPYISSSSALPAVSSTSTSLVKTKRLFQFDKDKFWTPLDNRILQVALPCIANFAINPLLGAVDLFWVGQMGNALAIAGQSAANQVFNSAFWLASFMPSVTATLVSKVYAEGDMDGVQETVCQALFLGFFIATISTAVLYPMAGKVLQSVLPKGAPALKYAMPYFKIRALAFLPSLVSVIGYAAFRGALDTVTPLRISLFANVFNAVLDPICIFRFGMGVPGAALATVSAEVISAVVYTWMLLRMRMIRWSKLLRLPKWSNLKPLLKGGAALQLRNLAINITFLAVARATQAIDDTGVAAAAHSIAIQVFQVGGIVLLALSTVAQTLVPSDMVLKTDPVTGKSRGGMMTAKQTSNRLMQWGLILGSCLGGLQIALLPFIHKISPLKEVQKAALVPSYLASFLQMINGMVFIGEGVMVGCGNFLQLSLSTMIATAAAAWALNVLPYKFGLTGVWLSFAVFNGLRLAGVWIHQTKTGPFASISLDVPPLLSKPNGNVNGKART